MQSCTTLSYSLIHLQPYIFKLFQYDQILQFKIQTFMIPTQQTAQPKQSYDPSASAINRRNELDKIMHSPVFSDPGFENDSFIQSTVRDRPMFGTLINSPYRCNPTEKCQNSLFDRPYLQMTHDYRAPMSDRFNSGIPNFLMDDDLLMPFDSDYQPDDIFGLPPQKDTSTPAFILNASLSGAVISKEFGPHTEAFLQPPQTDRESLPLTHKKDVEESKSPLPSSKSVTDERSCTDARSVQQDVSKFEKYSKVYNQENKTKIHINDVNNLASKQKEFMQINERNFRKYNQALKENPNSDLHGMIYDNVQHKFVKLNPNDSTHRKRALDQKQFLTNGSVFARMEAEMDFYKRHHNVEKNKNNKFASTLICQESKSKLDSDFIQPGLFALTSVNSPLRMAPKRNPKRVEAHNYDKGPDILIVGKDGVEDICSKPKLIQPLQVYHQVNIIDDDNDLEMMINKPSNDDVVFIIDNPQKISRPPYVYPKIRTDVSTFSNHLSKHTPGSLSYSQHRKIDDQDQDEDDDNIFGPIQRRLNDSKHQIRIEQTLQESKPADEEIKQEIQCINTLPITFITANQSKPSSVHMFPIAPAISSPQSNAPFDSDLISNKSQVNENLLKIATINQELVNLINDENKSSPSKQVLISQSNASPVFKISTHHIPPTVDIVIKEASPVRQVANNSASIERKVYHTRSKVLKAKKISPKKLSPKKTIRTPRKIDSMEVRYDEISSSDIEINLSEDEQDVYLLHEKEIQIEQELAQPLLQDPESAEQSPVAVLLQQYPAMSDEEHESIKGDETIKSAENVGQIQETDFNEGTPTEENNRHNEGQVEDQNLKNAGLTIEDMICLDSGSCQTFEHNPNKHEEKKKPSLLSPTIPLWIDEPPSIFFKRSLKLKRLNDQHEEQKISPSKNDIPQQMKDNNLRQSKFNELPRLTPSPLQIHDSVSKYSLSSVQSVRNAEDEIQIREKYSKPSTFQCNLSFRSDNSAYYSRMNEELMNLKEFISEQFLIKTKPLLKMSTFNSLRFDKGGVNDHLWRFVEGARQNPDVSIERVLLDYNTQYNVYAVLNYDTHQCSVIVVDKFQEIRDKEEKRSLRRRKRLVETVDEDLKDGLLPKKRLLDESSVFDDSLFFKRRLVVSIDEESPPAKPILKLMPQKPSLLSFL